jgi:hypothetical protein
VAIVYQQVFDCMNLNKYVITDAGNPVEVFSMGGVTPGPPDLAAEPNREHVSFTNMRVQSLIVGNRYRITVEDYVG